MKYKTISEKENTLEAVNPRYGSVKNKTQISIWLWLFLWLYGYFQMIHILSISIGFSKCFLLSDFVLNFIVSNCRLVLAFNMVEISKISHCVTICKHLELLLRGMYLFSRSQNEIKSSRKSPVKARMLSLKTHIYLFI